MRKFESRDGGYFTETIAPLCVLEHAMITGVEFKVLSSGGFVCELTMRRAISDYVSVALGWNEVAQLTEACGKSKPADLVGIVIETYCLPDCKSLITGLDVNPNLVLNADAHRLREAAAGSIEAGPRREQGKDEMV